MNELSTKRQFIGLLTSTIVGAAMIGVPSGAIAKTAAIKGKLKAANGKSFPFTYTRGQADGPTVVYIGGLGGRGNEVSKVAKDFTKAGLNLMTFDRAEPSCKSTKNCRVKVAARVASGAIMVDAKGAKSAADDIMDNELTTVLSYVTSAPDYNPKKGIVLIGGSYGSWLALVAARSTFKKHIKGVAFLSPAIAPQWISGSHAPRENVKAFKALVKSFGRRPSIAIGSSKDVFWQKTSTLEAAKMLNAKLAGKPAVVDVSSSKHSSKLLTQDRGLRASMIGWIAKTF